MHITPVITMTIVLSIYGNTSSRTAVSCKYWEDEYLYLHANCSYMNLQMVPVVSSNVSFLNLRMNSINVLENKTFLNMSILQELDLCCNQMEWLNQEAFIGLHNLKRLILSDNCLVYTSEHFAKSVFKHLKSLTYLGIQMQRPSIHDFSGNFSWFSKYVISDLTSLQILHTDVRSTNTDYVFREGFNLLTKLTKVSAGFCLLEANDKAFSNLPNLDSLELSHCIIQSYAVGTLQGRHIRYVNLRSAIITKKVVLNLLQDLEKSPIRTIVLTDALSFFITYIDDILKALHITGLQNLYLNQNDMKMLDCYEFSLPSTLKTLDLSSNELTSVCLIMPNLKSLNLEQNNLRDFLFRNTYYSNDPISYPTMLININLSYNNLYFLKVSIFHGHRCLTRLNISNNFLSDVNFDISHLKSLKVLDISNNRIEKFSRESMAQLNVLFDVSDIRVYLAGNSLQCSCEAIEFIVWILDKNEYFLRKNEIKCKFLNETEIFLKDFKNTMLQLKKNCTSRLVLIVSISIAITSMLIVLTFGIVYRYRWRLRYIYYMTKSKYTRDNLTQKDDQNYMYGAFISYSDDEQYFIINECIPILEKRDNVKLCIHKRDFLPGNEITHNITDSIHESRNVICIITKSFLESYYCMFEFNMARMESIYARNGKNMLFLVFYEQLRTTDLPLVMLELIEKDSYIEYPNDEQGNIVFWDKLKEAMK